jgi:hypothetical protein
MVYIIDHIHHLLNEFKKWILAYNSDRGVYRKLKTNEVTNNKKQ